jgi:hypothetical protein
MLTYAVVGRIGAEGAERLAAVLADARRMLTYKVAKQQRAQSTLALLEYNSTVAAVAAS